MVAGASRLGETSGSEPDERLHLEEVLAFRIGSGQVGIGFWHRLRGAGDLRGWVQGWRGTGERHTLATFCEPSGF
jgi:hypothetical protein